MRYLLLSITVFILINPLYVNAANSQTDKSLADTLNKWTIHFHPQLIFNQLSLSNWAAGGESSLSAKSTLAFRSVYQSNGYTFDYENKLAFGIVGYASKRIEKTEDKMDFNISFSRKINDKWSYTSMLTFKSQFANGYKYPNDSTLISTFMAPGYINTSLGFKCKPSENIDLFFSPASGKFTMVCNQKLADKGAFGVKRAIRDSLGNITQSGRNMLAEFGLNFLANYKKGLGENVELSTTLNLYNNYFDDVTSNRWNIDLDWETTINFSINKFLQTVLFVHLKYDHDVKFPNYGIVDGEEIVISESPRLQFKESIGIAFTYRI